MEQDGKVFYRSKRFWTSVVTSVLPLIPAVGSWISQNPEAYSAILGVVFGWVGIKTSQPMTFVKKF